MSKYSFSMGFSAFLTPLTLANNYFVYNDIIKIYRLTKIFGYVLL